ncbi:MAG: CdaR family protein [Firmicutes bacterium]|nr:CdaR family protein [Bacillota bacterium]
MNDLLDKKITVIILSAVLAIMLWLYVITEQNPVINKDLSLPIRLINTDTLLVNDLVLLDDEPFNVSIRLRGNKNYLDSMNRTTVSAFVDLKEIRSKGLVELPIDITGIPLGVDIFWVSSNRLSLNIDNIISEMLLVTLKITGSTLNGTAAMTPFTNPSEIMVKGAESIIETINKAEVSIDITNLDKTVSQKAEVVLSDEQNNTIEGLDINPKQVDVVVPIENTKSVAVEADYRVVPADGYVLTGVEINPKTVNIVGKKEVLDSITKITTQRIEFLDVKNSVEQKTFLILPEGVEIVNKNGGIAFSASVEKLIEKEIETNRVGVKNLSENFELEMIPIYLKAIIKGTESIVNSWDIDNAFYIDLLDLEEGTYNMPILFTKPEHLEVHELNPSEIRITLKKPE